MAQLDPAAVLTGTIDRRGMTLAVGHWTGDHKRSAVISNGIANCADLLVGRSEEKWGLDEVLYARAQWKGVSRTGRIE